MQRFFEKHAFGFDPRDHAQSRLSSAMAIQLNLIALGSERELRIEILWQPGLQPRHLEKLAAIRPWRQLVEGRFWRKRTFAS